MKNYDAMQEKMSQTESCLPQSKYIILLKKVKTSFSQGPGRYT